MITKQGTQEISLNYFLDLHVQEWACEVFFRKLCGLIWVLGVYYGGGCSGSRHCLITYDALVIIIKWDFDSRFSGLYGFCIGLLSLENGSWLLFWVVWLWVVEDKWDNMSRFLAYTHCIVQLGVLRSQFEECFLTPLFWKDVFDVVCDQCA